MSQEQLILKTLMDIKGDIGSLGQKIDSQVEQNIKRDLIITSHSDRLGNVENFHTIQKTKTGIIAALSASGVSVLAWVAKIILESHPKI